MRTRSSSSAPLRSEFPHLFKYIGDFKLVTSITEPVRFAENSASVNTK